MGNYSYYMDQKIKVLDHYALFALREKNENSYEFSNVITKTGAIDFQGLDNAKLYGYFYPETQRFLNAIAPFITGWAQFDYEHEIVFRIFFSKGKWKVKEAKLSFK